MKFLKSLVDEETRIGHAIGIFIQILIILSLVSFSLETLPNLSADFKNVLGIAELIIVVIFTAEYLVRLITAEKKLKFVFSFYGIIDLLAILPFYLAKSFDLRSLRIFRLLRLARALKMFRYTKATRKLKNVGGGKHYLHTYRRKNDKRRKDRDRRLHKMENTQGWDD